MPINRKEKRMNDPHIPQNDFDAAIVYITKLHKEHDRHLAYTGLLLAISGTINVLAFCLWVVVP